MSPPLYPHYAAAAKLYSGRETLLASPPCMKIIHKCRSQVNLVNKPSPEAKNEAKK